MAVINVTSRSGQSHVIEGALGTTLMENLREKGIDVEAICGGCCSCATCHVFIDKTWGAKVPAPTLDEQELLQNIKAYRPAESRLSCQVRLTQGLDGIVVAVAPAD